MPKPTTLFFDMDETLIENTVPFPDLFTQLYHYFDAELGADNFNSFIQRFREDAPILWQSMFDSPESPETQLEQCYERCIQATKAVDRAESKRIAAKMLEQFLQLSSAQVRFNPHAESTLAKLNELGFATGLITNGIEAIQLGKVRALKLDEKMNSITVSAQARAHKPLAAVFELALARAKAQAHEAWQVGDHATNDVAGAIRAGLGGIFYNPKNLDVGQAFSDLEERPTHTISSLNEIINLLDH